MDLNAFFEHNTWALTALCLLLVAWLADRVGQRVLVRIIARVMRASPMQSVKVQNWDKTITTIPTHRLIFESFRNWRGMSDSGGRRIKRAIHLDQTAIRYLGAEERDRMARVSFSDIEHGVARLAGAGAAVMPASANLG